MDCIRFNIRENFLKMYVRNLIKSEQYKHKLKALKCGVTDVVTFPGVTNERDLKRTMEKRQSRQIIKKRNRRDNTISCIYNVIVIIVDVD